LSQSVVVLQGCSDVAKLPVRGDNDAEFFPETEKIEIQWWLGCDARYNRALRWVHSGLALVSGGGLSEPDGGCIRCGDEVSPMPERLRVRV
jgi:hypothetical protein